MSKSDKKDLTVSSIDRQNILNNPYAIAEIEKAAQIQGIPFENKVIILKEQAASFFEVTSRTIENYLSRHEKELLGNGYEVLGELGHLDIGKLSSVLQHIQNDDYYPTFEDKLTHLFFFFMQLPLFC